MKGQIFILAILIGLAPAVAQQAGSGGSTSGGASGSSSSGALGSPASPSMPNNPNVSHPGNSAPGAEPVPGGNQLTNTLPENGVSNLWPNTNSNWANRNNGATNWGLDNGMTNGVKGNPYANYTNPYANYTNPYSIYTNR